jgi:Mn-containing catalase
MPADDGEGTATIKLSRPEAAAAKKAAERLQSDPAANPTTGADLGAGPGAGRTTDEDMGTAPDGAHAAKPKAQ